MIKHIKILAKGLCECGKSLFSEAAQKMISEKNIKPKDQAILAPTSKIDNRPICGTCAIEETISLIGKKRASV